MAQSKKRKGAKKHKSAVKSPSPPVIPERLRQYATALDIPAVRKKPRLLSLLFCDFSNRTEDLKVNLLGVFDRIYVPPEGNQMSPPFVLYARTAEAFEDNLWVRIFDPNDEPKAEIRFDPPEIKFEERDASLPIQAQFTIPLQLKLDKEGTYWFDIAYRDFSLGGAGLQVKFRKIEEGKDATDTYL